MRKIIFIIFLLLIGCDVNYRPNNLINKRKPPVTVIAIDTATNSVLFRDGDNKVFTIFDNPTTKSITKSLKIGDTVRLKENGELILNTF